MNYASRTGDGALLLAESEAGCEGCIERVTEVAGLTRGRNSDRLFGSAAVTIGSYTTKDSPTAKPVTTKPSRYAEKVALSPSDGNWVMYEIELEES